MIAITFAVGLCALLLCIEYATAAKLKPTMHSFSIINSFVPEQAPGFYNTSQPGVMWCSLHM